VAAPVPIPEQVVALACIIAERKVKAPIRATEIISADELESIHRASLKVLSEIGMDSIIRKLMRC